VLFPKCNKKCERQNKYGRYYLKKKKKTYEGVVGYKIGEDEKVHRESVVVEILSNGKGSDVEKRGKDWGEFLLCFSAHRP